MKKRKLVIITVLALLLVFTSFISKETLAKEESEETGWITNADGSESYLLNGNKLKGWQYIDGYWRYFRTSGTMVKSRWEWLPIQGKTGVYNWKFFNYQGKSINQFYSENGSKWLSQSGPDTTYYKGIWENPENGFVYFFRQSSGTMAYSWQYINGSWRYLRDSGTMVQEKWEWLPVEGQKGSYSWKYFNDNGASQDKFYEQDGTFWLSQSKPTEGYVRGYWVKEENGDTFYFRQSTGTMVTGWQYIDGKWQFFKDSGVLVETDEEIRQLGETPRNTSSSPKVYTLSQLRFHGVIKWGGYKFTYYSQSVLPGGGLRIPGRHVSADGYVCDGDGYIVLANSSPNGTIIDTPFGAKGKVYDSGTYGNHFDVYTK